MKGRYSIFTLLLCFFLLPAWAQDASEKGELKLSGKVVNENKRGQESVIYVYRQRELIKEVPTSRIGKFEFEVPLQDSVAFVVFSDGYVSKTVVVSAEVPKRREKEKFIFPFFIDLYPVGRIPSHIDLDRPVGKITFAGTQFVYDIAFTKESNEKLKEFVRERKNMRVRPLTEE